MHKKTRLKFRNFLGVQKDTWTASIRDESIKGTEILKLSNEFNLTIQEIYIVLRSGKSKKLTINKTGIKK